MAEFLTELSLAYLREENDRPVWKLEQPLVYRHTTGETITAPAGFMTDLASVPRVPVAYWLTGGTATRPSVIHDFLYTAGYDRKYADDVFLAAMEAEGVPWWRRRAMHAAVRMFGGGAYATKAA